MAGQHEAGRRPFDWNERKAIVVAVAAAVVVLLLVTVLSVAGVGKKTPSEISRNAAGSDASTTSFAGSATDGGASDITAVPVREKTTDTYALNPYDLANLPETDSVVTVNLSPGGEPAVLESDQLQAIYDALSVIEENGPCGFVFFDTDTGHGIVYNAGEVMYIASASKMALAYYALQQGAAESDYTLGSIEEAIVDSGNDSYESFGYQYFTEDYVEWLGGYGVDHSTYTGDLYPPMSARSLAGIWGEVLQYIRGGSDDAQWFAGLLAMTDRRFIGDALEGDGAVVLSKAGWITDWEFDAVADAGIIQSSDGTYLMAIVSNQPAWQGCEEAEGDLAKVLYDLRFDM